MHEMPDEAATERHETQRWRLLVHRFVAEDGAQDLVEYALITGFIGIVGYVVLDLIGVEVFNTYSSWIDPAYGVPSRWDPPNPSGGGS